MPATVHRLPQLPVIVTTVIEPFDPLKDMAAAEQESAALVATIEGPIYRIIDIRQ